MSTGQINTPIAIYIVHHPACKQAEQLARNLFQWFRLSDLAGDAAAAGLPVYYRRYLMSNSIYPRIEWEGADLNVAITLIDDLIVLDPIWREAISQLTQEAEQYQHRALLLPVALDEKFLSDGATLSAV